VFTPALRLDLPAPVQLAVQVRHLPSQFAGPSAAVHGKPLYRQVSA